MITLKANRPLVGDYGQVDEGQTFVCSDDVAESLVSRGLASHLPAPKCYWRAPENKMTAPAETPRIETAVIAPAPAAVAPAPKGKRK